MKRMVLATILCAASMAAVTTLSQSANSADSQGFVPYTGPFDFYVISGTCSVFVTEGSPPTRCDNVLVVAVEDTRHASLTFSRGSSKLVFLADSLPMVPRTSVDGVIVDRVTMRATGSCRVGDAYRGPAVIECEAHGLAGTAHVVFTSDGSSPDHVMI